ncbi:MAG: glutathione S-transferase, partial [Stellaceae bacterium]
FKGPEGFAALKASGRLPFQAVPVWEEDGFTLAQSGAILLHVGRNHGLYGSTPREAALIDEALGAMDDTRAELRKVMMVDPAKRAEVRAEVSEKSLPRWFGFLEKLLARNDDGKGFLVGKSVSIADLALYYVIEYARDNGFGKSLADCPRLTAFADRIAARPKIAAWLASPKRPPVMLMPA